MNAPSSKRSAPEPAAPDTKDWTWVVDRPCPECGFDPASVVPEGIPAILADVARNFSLALGRADAGVRPDPRTWSAVEYGQHVADVLAVMTGRLELILASDGRGTVFADWDQDAAAVEKQYWCSTGPETAILIEERAAAAAEVWARPAGEQWGWPGTRSNGSQFTAARLGTYIVHDIVHHLHDVGEPLLLTSSPDSTAAAKPRTGQ